MKPLGSGVLLTVVLSTGAIAQSPQITTPKQEFGHDFGDAEARA